MTDENRSAPCCSLDATDRKRRANWFESNIEPILEDVTLEDDALHFRFEDGAGDRDEIFELVQKERACCPFFEFSIRWEAGGGPVDVYFEHEDVEEIVELDNDLYDLNVT